MRWALCFRKPQLGTYGFATKPNHQNRSDLTSESTSHFSYAVSQLPPGEAQRHRGLSAHAEQWAGGADWWGARRTDLKPVQSFKASAWTLLRQAKGPRSTSPRPLHWSRKTRGISLMPLRGASPVHPSKKLSPTFATSARGVRSTSWIPVHLLKKSLGMVSIARRGARLIPVRAAHPPKKWMPIFFYMDKRTQVYPPQTTALKKKQIWLRLVHLSKRLSPTSVTWTSGLRSTSCRSSGH